MSSQAIQLLEQPHDPPTRQEQSEESIHEDDNDGTLNGEALLPRPAPEDLEMRPSSPLRSLTYVNGLAIVIGLQVGAGIFSTPAVVRANVDTTTGAILVWILAGILVWMGASAFVELGTRIPHNGGMQEYIWHCYGDAYGFVFAWAWILLSRPCAMAMVALVCSEYLFKTLSPDHDVDTWLLKGTALVAIAGITLLNIMGTSIGTGSANIFLVLKVFALGTIAIAGVVFAIGDFTREVPVDPPTTTEPMDWSLWPSIGGFANAILASLFAYGGNESLGFIVGEMKDPHQALPRVVHTAMPVIIVLFVSSNFAIYHELSKEVLQKTNAVAIAFGRKVLGELGAWFYALMVSICSLGSLNAIVFSASRLTQAAGARDYIPAFLGATDSANSKSRRVRVYRSTCSSCVGRFEFLSPKEGQNVPIKAMLLNAALAMGYVLLSNFRELLSFKSMMELGVFVATVGGIFVLRSQPLDPDKESANRHYQAPTINLITFCSIGSLIFIRSAITHILQFLTIAAFFGAGLVIYRLTLGRTKVETTLITGR